MKALKQRYSSIPINSILGLLFVLSFSSCHKTDIDGYKQYTILEGNHYAEQYLDFRPLQDDELHQSIYFGYECWYDNSYVTHSGYNKLTGLSQILQPHSKSGRIVWQPDYNNVGKIKLSGYVYGADTVLYNVNPSGWFAKPIITVTTGDPFDVRVHRWDDKWEFLIRQHGETRAVWIYADMPNTPLQLEIPYFGGKDAAYYDMSIYIKEL